MENEFLMRKVNGEKIFFSELLVDPPSDEILAELFPNEADLDRKVVWCHED